MYDKEVVFKCDVKEWVDPAQLLVIQKNLKNLTQENYLKLKNQITRDGFTAPFFVWEDDGIFKILDGTQRFRTLMQMREENYRFEKVPVVKIEADDEKQARRVLLSLASQYGEFTMEGLGEYAIESGIDFVDLEKEFRIPEIDFKMFDDLFNKDSTDKKAIEDEVPEIDESKVKTKLGDIYELGEHRLMCGDSTDKELVEELMNGEDSDLLTDPPYGINANKQTLGNGKKSFYRGKDWDKAVPDFFHLLPLFKSYVLWGGNYFADKLKPTNDWLCWHKKIDGVSFSEFELAYTNSGKNCRHLSHHWSGEEKLHPTMKPVKVMEWCLEFLGKNITDLFGGSGSVLIACEKTKRKCFMMELDPYYCDVIVNRWAKYTNKNQIKLNGKPIIWS